MTATNGTEVKSLGTLDVVDGGTLTATGATFAGAGGDIQVRPGGTADFTLSTLTAPLTANVGSIGSLQSADVSVILSTASAIGNLPKDLPGMSAVDGAGSAVAVASSHTHLCIPPTANPPLPTITRTLWDVEGTIGRVDSPPCPLGYTEAKGHP